jgi:hypothetical protein
MNSPALNIRTSAEFVTSSPDKAQTNAREGGVRQGVPFKSESFAGQNKHRGLVQGAALLVGTGGFPAAWAFHQRRDMTAAAHEAILSRDQLASITGLCERLQESMTCTEDGDKLPVNQLIACEPKDLG